MRSRVTYVVTFMFVVFCLCIYLLVLRGLCVRRQETGSDSVIGLASEFILILVALRQGVGVVLNRVVSMLLLNSTSGYYLFLQQYNRYPLAP